MKNKLFLWLIIPFMLLTLGATSRHQTTDEMNKGKEYRISTSVHQINGAVWVFETKYDIHTGKILSRKQVHSKKYRNIK